MELRLLGAVLISFGQQLGLDPTHLGAIMVINFAVGTATPPFGYSLLVAAAALARWVPDAELRRRILVDNPAELYGF